MPTIRLRISDEGMRRIERLSPGTMAETIIVALIEDACADYDAAENEPDEPPLLRLRKQERKADEKSLRNSPRKMPVPAS